jgi:hypothetical protein
MAPNLKRKLESFNQRALMISSCGELSTQALENVQSARSTGVRLDASASGGSGSHGEVGAPLSGIIGASCSDASSSMGDINTDIATEGCPAAASPKCKKPRKR